MRELVLPSYTDASGLPMLRRQWPLAAIEQHAETASILWADGNTWDEAERLAELIVRRSWECWRPIWAEWAHPGAAGWG